MNRPALEALRDRMGRRNWDATVWLEDVQCIVGALLAPDAVDALRADSKAQWEATQRHVVAASAASNIEGLVSGGAPPSRQSVYDLSASLAYWRAEDAVARPVALWETV